MAGIFTFKSNRKWPDEIYSAISLFVSLAGYADIGIWGIESSFRKLKYTIGLSHYHSYKPDFIKQEIWAKFIAYNATELLVAHTVVAHGKRKYSYKVNFTLAAHICRIYLRLHTETDSINVMALLQKELVPIRCDRQFPRLKTAHFRKPKYLIYRVS